MSEPLPAELDVAGAVVAAEGTRLLLCRHGQTAMNAQSRYQGQIDAPLDATGRTQAAALAVRLAGERIDAAVSSDLRRAAQTAAIALGERKLPVAWDARLREAAFGRWEGLNFAEIEQRYPDDAAARRADPVRFAIPGGGESLLDVAVRAAAFLREALPQHAGQSLLLVAHGGTLNSLLTVLLRLPLSSWSRLRNHNANLSMLDILQGRPRLLIFNETWHLEEQVP
ncbi:MAG: histidine phosphatase family protein [Chloroflexota bacterium]